MSDLTGKFEILQEQLEAADAAMQVDLNAIREELGLLNAQIDTLNLNGAANTRALLAALGASSPCMPCPTPALTIPPVDGTVNPINPDKCKRAQAFVHALLEIATTLDAASAFAIPFNPVLITDAMSQVATALANGDPTPLPSWSEANGIVNGMISWIAGNFFVGGTLTSLVAGMAFEIRDATYSAATPEAAKSAYEAVVDASGAPSYAIDILKRMAWNALYSFYFDPASDVNLTGYDGGICSEIAPTTCFRRVSILQDVGGGMRETILMSHLYDNWSVSWPDAPPGDNSVAIFADAHPGVHITSDPLVIDPTYENVTLDKFWFSREGAAYELEFCPPEV